MTPDQMNIKKIIPFLEEHGQHFTCDHNSNFDQGICERAIYFLKLLNKRIATRDRKIEKLYTHISFCTILRFSTLGCICGLYKKEK